MLTWRTWSWQRLAARRAADWMSNLPCRGRKMPARRGLCGGLTVLAWRRRPFAAGFVRLVGGSPVSSSSSTPPWLAKSACDYGGFSCRLTGLLGYWLGLVRQIPDELLRQTSRLGCRGMRYTWVSDLFTSNSFAKSGSTDMRAKLSIEQLHCNVGIDMVNEVFFSLDCLLRLTFSRFGYPANSLGITFESSPHCAPA